MIGKGSTTEKISAYVDIFLRRFAPRIPSYVKDITLFLNIVKHLKIQSTDLLVTIHVKSLYTNIPHTEDLAAITKMMEDSGPDTLHRMFIRNLAHQVPTKNYFILHKQIYIQKQGTAIGTRVTPNYKIILMYYLESNFLDTITRKHKIRLWFIDDIFMIWSHWLWKLKHFMDSIVTHMKLKGISTISGNWVNVTYLILFGT